VLLCRGARRVTPGPSLLQGDIEYAAMKISAFILLLSLLPALAFAGGVYQEPDAFIAEVFADKPPEAEVIWLTTELKAQIKDILGHNYKGLRIRYWQQQHRTAWVLDETGKDKPITAGVVISNGRIERVRVLIFRESRGWEVRYPFFTDQFDHAALSKDRELDRTIDNISGATLSVHAVTKLARVALLLDKAVNTDKKS
jgi:hypothetical protein